MKLQVDHIQVDMHVEDRRIEKFKSIYKHIYFNLKLSSGTTTSKEIMVLTLGPPKIRYRSKNYQKQREKYN